MVSSFVRFGPGHALTIAVIAAAAVAAARAPQPFRGALRVAIAIALAAAMLAFVAAEAIRGTLTLTDVLPFHLSDFTVFLAIGALLALRQRAAELLYFLSVAAVLATLTPDVARALPHPYTIIFFVLHGGTIVAASLLTFGYGLRPERGAVARALLFLNAYALFAALMNATFDTNFLYLRGKPSQPSLLDWMGPWPWYIVSAEIVAAAFFFAADLPFRRTRAR